MKIQYLLLLPCTYRMEKPEPVRLTKQMQTSSKRAVHGHRGQGAKTGCSLYSAYNVRKTTIVPVV